MPPITRSGRRGRRGGANNNPLVVQEQAENVQEGAVVVQPVQQNVQAVVVPPLAVPVYAPPNVDQVFIKLKLFKLCNFYGSLHRICEKIKPRKER